VSKKNILTRESLELIEISDHFEDSDKAIRLFFDSIKNKKINVNKYMYFTFSELNDVLNKRIVELEKTSSLTLLSLVESRFRTDYINRVTNKYKDNVSKDIRILYKQKGTRVSLEDDILEIWKINTSGSAHIISELKGIFKYRHWLAHGRYWNPKLGSNKYDYLSIYSLTFTIINHFKFK